MEDSCSEDLSDPNYAWEEDRRYVLRGWALLFSILTTFMLLTALDGRMAHMKGSYTGYVGVWINCRKYDCPNLGQVTVLIHMSMGFMILALTQCFVLLLTMSLSFWPVFRRLNKLDLIFSFLSFSIGLLVLLSMTLFVVNCQTVAPRPQITYLITTYLCWGAGALILWTGVLSYLNYRGLWSEASFSWDRRVSYRRWASRLNSERPASRLSTLRQSLEYARSLSQQGPPANRRGTSIDRPPSLAPAPAPAP